MTIMPKHLNIEIRATDRLCTEFYQPDENRVEETLRKLNNPRLFIQPKLVLASENRVSTITSGTIDLILARTNAPLPSIFPLNSPAGPITIDEAGEDFLHTPFSSASDEGRSNGIGWRTFRVEFHTLGGWKGALDLRAQDRGTALDRRQAFTHYFELPVIPFKLRAGGIGLINPANLTWVSANPVPDAISDSALRMELLRNAPVPSRTSINTLTIS